MAFYRRRFRKSYGRRRRYTPRKSRSLRRIKKDILKCNFPTKIKMIGLPEKKTMFLTHQTDLVTAGPASKKILYLYPTECENLKTLYRTNTMFKESKDTIDSYLANWDKYCILAVYIKIQPQANVFDGSDGKTIIPVKCYYAMNNNVSFYPEKKTVDNKDYEVFVKGHKPKDILEQYGHDLLIEKPVFTFNSNEHCTFVLRAPNTMETDTPVVHKKYQWWSLVDQALITENERVFSGSKTEAYDLKEKTAMEDEEESEDDGIDVMPLSTPIAPLRTSELPAIHCGHLYFESDSPVKLNVTINYKIALRG